MNEYFIFISLFNVFLVIFFKKMFKIAINFILFCYLLQNQLIEAQVLTNDQIQQMAAMLHKHCKEESGVADEIIYASRTGQLSSDPAFKCYIACTMEFIGAMDSDGNISYDHIYDLLPTEHKAVVDSITTKCSGICKIFYYIKKNELFVTFYFNFYSWSG